MIRLLQRGVSPVVVPGGVQEATLIDDPKVRPIQPRCSPLIAPIKPPIKPLSSPYLAPIQPRCSALIAPIKPPM